MFSPGPYRVIVHYPFAIVSIELLPLSVSGPKFDSVESLFFSSFFSPLFFSASLFLLDIKNPGMGSNQSLPYPNFFSYHIFPPLLHLFFCLPLISSSRFPLPSFLYPFFSYSFLSFSSSCFLFIFPFLLLFPSLFSLYFILLISSSFSPPLSFSFFSFLSRT